MVKDIRYIIKRIIIGVGIAVAVFSIKSCDVHAMTTKLYNGNTLCGSCNYAQYGCTYSGINACANINRVSVVHDDYVLQKTLKYTLYTTIDVDIQKNNCTNNNFGLRSDFYTGNKAGNSWNDASTIIWNNVDDINVGTNGSCRYTWGLVQDFTSKVNSTGMTFDFYFTNAQPMKYIKVKRFELQNQTSSGSNQSDTINAINNQTNAYINNNNSNTNKIIENQNENTDKINDTLTDDSVDNPSSDINTMKNKLSSNSTITQLLTLPITLYQSVLNNINGSCSAFTLGTLYNHTLTMPCINLQSILGSTLWSIIDILCCGLFILAFRKRMVDIFNNMTSLKDRGNELE